MSESYEVVHVVDVGDVLLSSVQEAEMMVKIGVAESELFSEAAEQHPVCSQS